ncbi:hypothetical protein ACH4M4_19215 [Streptomyces sp. NPDC017254]|uniref:hypothetical protein n=1 Tax=unclassified Streptomyces TaxID=2593676 RepID=UPI0037884DA5
MPEVGGVAADEVGDLGTLEQLAGMPFKASDVIGGKIAPYFVLAAFDMVLVTVLGCLLFGA